MYLIKASGKFSSLGGVGVKGGGCISQSLSPQVPEPQKPGPHDDRSKKVFAWFILDHQGDCALRRDSLLHIEEINHHDQTIKARSTVWNRHNGVKVMYIQQKPHF